MLSYTELDAHYTHLNTVIILVLDLRKTGIGTTLYNISDNDVNIG